MISMKLPMYKSNAMLKTYLKRRTNLPSEILKEPDINTVLIVHLKKDTDHLSLFMWGSLDILDYISEYHGRKGLFICHTWDTYWLKPELLNTFLDIVFIYKEGEEIYSVSLIDMLYGRHPEFGVITPQSDVLAAIHTYFKNKR